MRLAAIVVICLLSICALGKSARVAAMFVLPVTQPQDNQPDNSTPSTAKQSPTDQKNADSGTSSPQAATAPCPNNSQSTAKSDCKPATKTRRHRKSVAPAQTTTAPGPTTTVVRNGGTDDSSLNLSPGVNPQQASRQVDSTNKLLATSDANLKKISGRQLTASQQDTVKQIKSYMDQAKKAAAGGDVQRGYNLAVKANLLSAELAGH